MKDCPREENKCRHYCIVCSCCGCECMPENHRVYNKDLVFSGHYQMKPELNHPEKCMCLHCRIDRQEDDEKKPVLEIKTDRPTISVTLAAAGCCPDGKGYGKITLVEKEIEHPPHVFEEGKTPVAHGLANLVANKIFEDERLEQAIFKAVYKIAIALKKEFEVT